VMEFRSYNMVTTAIQNATSQLAIHAAFSNITEVYFCFSHDFVALTGAGAGDAQMPFFAGGANQDAQTRFRRHLKDINFLAWPEYMTSYGLGTTEAKHQKSERVPQWRILAGTKPIERLWATGSVKSVELPSPEEATPLGEVPCCGKLLKLDSTTPFSKESGGTRVMTGSNGNNLSRYMDNPQAHQLRPLWKDMLGSQRLNGYPCAMMDDQSGACARYSPAICESIWVY